MQDFEQLAVWKKKAHALVLRVYDITKAVPPIENFGLTANLRRTAISMTSRIAEGAGKSTDFEFGVELKRARAVAFELGYLLLLARDLIYISPETYEEAKIELVEVRKMISGLIGKLAISP